jgi:hypothetical protein
VPDDVTDGLEERELNPGRYYWARQHLDLMNPRPKGADRPRGGEVGAPAGRRLSDNIGLRSILPRLRPDERIRCGPGSARATSSGSWSSRSTAGPIRPNPLSRRERSPGLVDVFLKTATVSMETVSFDTIEQALRRQTEREQAQTDIRKCNEALARCGASVMPELAQEIRTCFVHIDFEGLRRRYAKSC